MTGVGGGVNECCRKYFIFSLDFLCKDFNYNLFLFIVDKYVCTKIEHNEPTCL